MLGIIDIDREIGPYLKCVERVGLPYHTKIATHIVALVARVALGILRGIGAALKQIDAVCARPVVAVGIGIHHIAAHLDRVTAANIEIKSYGIGGIDAVSSTKAAETGSVAVTETGIIAVVEIAQQRKLVVVEKAVDHKAAL